METLNNRQKLFHFSQRAVASKGFTEAVTWSFTDSKVDNCFSELKAPIRLSNPISSDLNIMRNSLFPNLLDISSKNFSKGIDASEIFELGYVFEGTSFKNQKTSFIGKRNY